jgi:hypothetical protein
MKYLKRVFGLQLVAVAFGAAGCGAATDVDSTDADDETVASVESAFQNSLSFVNCGQAQINTIQTFANFLSDRIYEAQGTRMRDCLNDTFPSRVNSAKWTGEVWAEFNRAGTTRITCTNNLAGACGSNPDVWGCAQVGISGEDVVLANQMINDPTVSIATKAAVLAHELAHNYGHTHPNAGDGDGEYTWTMPERVAACVQNSNNRLPAGQSRTNGMPGEVELGYVGRFGGTPFELAGTGTQFATGFTTLANATVNALQVRFTDASGVQSFSPTVGGSAGVQDVRMCPAGEVLVGISGRAGTVVNRLIARCARRSDLGGAHDLNPSGDNVGIDYSTVCPAGKAVRQVRGRAGGSIDQIRLVCDNIGRSFSSAHVPHKVGPIVGSASGVQFALRCSGNGALSSFVGRSGGAMDRLGAMCTATGGTLPVTANGPVHPASNWLGGTGGSAFAPNACPPGELMVGAQIRSGSSINAIAPVCAPASQWDSSSSGSHDLGFSGNQTGTLTRVMCPSFEFLVGLQLWGTNLVNGFQAVCADMR